jgi:hypothetical protein
MSVYRPGLLTWFFDRLLPWWKGETQRIKEEQLAEVQVYASDRIDTRLIVEMDGHEFSSRQIQSSASHQVIEDKLLLHVVADDDDLDSGYIPPALSETLLDFCQITSTQDAQMLTQILNSNHEHLLKRDLEYRTERMPLAARQRAGKSPSSGQAANCHHSLPAHRH